MVPELHDMRTVCLLKAVTPAWVAINVPFLLVIDFTRYSDSFDILQAKVKGQLLVGCAFPFPRGLNKHYAARGKLINVSFMYIT